MRLGLKHGMTRSLKLGLKHLTLPIALGVALCCGIVAQEKSEPRREGAQHEDESGSMGWKWANFAILAAGLGYFIGRNAPAFFRGRSEEIRKGIEEATRMKREAEARAAEIERQVAGLGAEVERLRTDARNEMAAEGQRITGETARRLAKIQQQAEQEIVSLGKAARQELQAYAASLAIDLASQHVRSRMNPEIEHRLVDAFVADLHHGAVDRGVGASRGVSPQ